MYIRLKKADRIILMIMMLIGVIAVTSLTAFADTMEGKESGSVQSIKVTIRSSADTTEDEIIPEISTGTDGNKIAVITPISIVRSNRGKTAEIRYSELKSFAEANQIKSIEIVTGYAATSYTTVKPNAQTVIVDDNGNTMFEARATGGQLRLDKKMNETSIVGDYNNTQDKKTAIDFADLRLQYRFTLPSDLDISKVKWGWTVNYTKINKEAKTIIVDGKKYMRGNSETDIANNTNTFISNVVVTDVPVHSYQYKDFNSNMYMTYEYEGVKYTFNQPESNPLARNINDLVTYYKGATIYNSLDDVNKAYINAIKEYVDDGSYTPVA